MSLQVNKKEVKTDTTIELNFKQLKQILKANLPEDQHSELDGLSCISLTMQQKKHQSPCIKLKRETPDQKLVLKLE